MEHARTRAALRGWMGLLISVSVALIAFVLMATSQPPPIEGAELRPRHLGYGIHVGPHLRSRPDVLGQLGMDWVKIYDIAQTRDYPGINVMYRIEMRSLPDDAFINNLPQLAKTLVDAGVDAVEIGNEPNLGVEWDTGPPNPEQYAEGLCRSYRAIKAAYPQLVIVSGGLAPTAGTPDGLNMDDFEYARRMLNAGAGACFDAFGYHPYGFNQPPEADPYANPFSFRRAERMYQLMLSYGIIDKQIWVTEFGWVRNPAEDGLNQCTNAAEFRDFAWMAFDSETQAGYIARAFRFAERNWPWAGPMFLWNLNWNEYQDLNYEPLCSQMRFYGILKHDGTPLPAFYAVQQLQKRAPLEYRPSVGAVIHNMTAIVEAGCGGYLQIGSFSVRNAGYPGPLEVQIEPANGPGLPVVGVSQDVAHSGDRIDVFVDATDAPPGLHLVAINLRSTGGTLVSSRVVRGWLFVTYPTTPECKALYEGETG